MKDKSILAANFASQIVFFFRIICENNCVNKGVDEVLYNLTIMSGLGVYMHVHEACKMVRKRSGHMLHHPFH